LIKFAGMLKLARNLMSKKILIILFSLILFSPQILADSHKKYELDIRGNLVQFWLEGKDLKYLDQNLLNAKTLYSFTREVESFSIHHESAEYFLTYTFKNEIQNRPVYYSYSNNEGRSFSPPLVLTSDGANPSLAFSNNFLAIAWEDKEGIALLQSSDDGRSFSLPLQLTLTGEALSSPALSLDTYNNLHLAFLSQNQYNHLSRIFYAQILSNSFNPSLPIELKEIFRSQDELTPPLIKNLPSLLILWQEKYNQRLGSYLSLSLDNGKTFSRERAFICDQQLEDFSLVNGKYYLLTYDGKPITKEIKFPDIYAPKIVSPVTRQAYAASSFLIKYLFPDYQRDWSTPAQWLSEIDLSTDSNFPSLNTLVFESLISATPEALEYRPPLNLPDGNYYLRISVSDGLSRSAYGPIVTFKIDNLLPDLITLEAETSLNTVTFKGRTNKLLVNLSLNGTPVSFQSDNRFQSQVSLAAGQNKFTFVLSDAAGNQNILTREVYYNPQAPSIQLTNPSPEQWFKPGSTVFFAAIVMDAQNDIDDETEAHLFINAQVITDPLIYNLQENKLTGFIALPPALLDGKYPAKIELSDRSGNIGKIDFTINIDGTAPALNPSQSNQLYTNSKNSINLPLTDQGAGIDPGGTLIKIAGISMEGTASTEGDYLKVLLKSPLPEGSYEVQVLPRDRVGNIGSVRTFSLIVDNTPPQLTLEGSWEPVTQLNTLTVRGKVADQNPCRLNIFDNNYKVASLDLNNATFSKEIRLSPGNNYLLVEAVDLAGNKTAQTFMMKAQISSYAVLLKDCKNGPNPFSSLTGTMYFSYTLNSPPVDPVNLKIYVYDLTGRLLWKKEISNSPASDNIPWDGTNPFGNKLSNGVYPYFISVSAGDQREIRRGKIVVLN